MIWPGDYFWVHEVDEIKSGSRYPSTGVAIALNTLGFTSLGPGPSNTRLGGINSPTGPFGIVLPF